MEHLDQLEQEPGKFSTATHTMNIIANFALNKNTHLNKHCPYITFYYNIELPMRLVTWQCQKTFFTTRYLTNADRDL